MGGGDSGRSAALVALGSVLFGTTGLFVVALAGLALPTLLALRYALGALALALAFGLAPRLRRDVRAPRAAWPHLAGLGALLVAVDVAFYAAIPRVGVGLAAILLYTAPLFVAILSALFLREPPTRRTLLGLALGFGGVLLVVRPDPGDVTRTLWVLAGLASGLAWAGWLVVSRAAGARDASGEAQGLASQVVGALLAAPVALALAPEAPTARELALAAGLGLVASGLALVLIARGLRGLDATRAAVVGYLEPLTAVALGAALLGERYGPVEGAGSALILAGTLVVTFAPGPVAPLPPEP